MYIQFAFQREKKKLGAVVRPDDLLPCAVGSACSACIRLRIHMRPAPLARLVLVLSACSATVCSELECEASMPPTSPSLSPSSPLPPAHGCTVVWREPTSAPDPEGSLLTALLEAAHPYRPSPAEVGEARDAERLQAAAVASRKRARALSRGATTSTRRRNGALARLLRELAGTLEADAALLQAPEPRSSSLARQSVTEGYYELMRSEAARWPVSMAQIAVNAVRVAFARFAMLADNPYDRFMALFAWVEPLEPEEPFWSDATETTRHFCAPGTDAELTMVRGGARPE